MLERLESSMLPQPRFPFVVFALVIIASSCGDSGDSIPEDAMSENVDASVDATPLTTAQIDVQCNINSGSGSIIVSINDVAFCSVENSPVPALGSGSGSVSCIPDSPVTISAICSATNCRVFAESFDNLDCPFAASGFLTGSFGGSAGFATSASINCTCQ